MRFIIFRILGYSTFRLATPGGTQAISVNQVTGNSFRMVPNNQEFT